MFLCVVAPSFFHVLRFLSVSFVCERKGAFRFGLSVAVSFIFQRFRFLKERLFAHVLRFRPVSSFRERMGVFSRPAPPSFAHVLRKIDFRPDVCEKRYRMRAILPVERQSIANTCVCLDLTESQKYLRLKISNGTRLYQICSERQ